MMISTRRSPRGRFLQRVFKPVFGFSAGRNRLGPFIEYTSEGQDGITYRIVMNEDDLAKANSAMVKAKELETV